MNKLNMIETKWEDEELNGLSTMIAVEYYNNMDVVYIILKKLKKLLNIMK